MTVIVRAFRRHPRWYVAALVVLLLVVVATIWLVSRSTARAEPQLATARTGQLDRTVVVTGTVEPSQRADLDFPAGGEVVSVTAAVGQQVAAGQALAAVDSASLSGQVAQARSALASAQARLAADRSADASSEQIDADEAAVDSAQAQLDVARRNEDNATLTAPFAGTVAAVNVTVGEQVTGGAGGSSAASAASAAGVGGAAGGGGGGGISASGGAAVSSGSTAATAGPGTADVVVVSTGSYLIDATVDDTQVGQLRPGLDANITPNGATAAIPGTVESVALVATSTSGVAAYPVTIAVTGSPPGLHIGSTAQAEIVTERITDAVLVPSAAVRGTGEETSVVVRQGDDDVTRPVEVGVTSAGRTQILRGLASGEQVVLPETGEAPAQTGFGGFGPNRQGGGGSGGQGGGAGNGGGAAPNGGSAPNGSAPNGSAPNGSAPNGQPGGGS